ncbi:hypothetical protein PACILC2_01880 [Paenibacillus cisolokensis]|uniref:HMA domain-containing protein n=1 Tax=Paenibacillus cisolokensis TaxID=1658519 RepID=A0ABQ4N0E9_9BACL|nr:hypothetical protein [Paenibacillus cisolokensis]GIQ61620.1 hypothetical protein PACILC2_01880 [Paenibacillus cisolokensis]
MIEQSRLEFQSGKALSTSKILKYFANLKVGVLTMSLPKKMDQKTANEIRSILTKMNITQSKVKINLDNQTIEVEDDYSIDDILESAGVLTP